jgi:hypothetical protein
MQDIEKNFVSYNLAFKLKELGFNEECLAKYDCQKDLVVKGCYENSSIHHLIIEKDLHDSQVLAPLYQQVTEWLRNEHNLHIELFNSSYGNWCVRKIVEVKGGGEIKIDSNYYLTNYYDALTEGIIECLEQIKSNMYENH